jgi:LmbE family N-acetylglucosaminyl deacetylase
MSTSLKLMAVLAHPDDESLGMGGTLARYAGEGIETYLVTATLGQSGRFRGISPGPGHPGAEELGRIRERELPAAFARWRCSATTTSSSIAPTRARPSAASPRTSGACGRRSW